METTAASYSPEYLAESRTALLNAFYSIPIPLEILSTAFRLWVKARPSSKSHLTFDDYLIIWATISAVAECIAGLVYGAPNGLGRHIEAVSTESLSMFLKGDYIFSHFYDVAIASTKLSILALYYRIFETVRFRRVVVGTAIFVAAWLVSIEVALGLGCRPLQGWWDAAAADAGNCVDKVAFTYATNSINLATDLWIFVMPVPIILGLQASMDRRVMLCFLFSVGLATCAISAARLSVIVGVGSTDVTWYEVSLGILSAWEPCGGILCANLPVVYRVMVRGLKQLTSAARSSRSRSLLLVASDDAARHRRGSSGGIRKGKGSDGKDRPNSQSPLYHDWTRLNNSSGASSDATNHVFPKISAGGRRPSATMDGGGGGGGGGASELDTLGNSSIMVERSFKQDFVRKGRD